jgi:hypothetical protein
MPQLAAAHQGRREVVAGRGVAALRLPGCFICYLAILLATLAEAKRRARGAAGKL